MQIATGVVGGMPTTPQSAPPGGPYVHEAPPPTTPTTFIMRDTQHRPASRVLRQVSPLDGGYSSDEPSAARHTNRGLGLLPHTQPRRPAGPRRAPFEHAHRQRIPSTATDATSSVGLGSLLHDSSVVPAEPARPSLAATPRHVPFGRRIDSGSPQSAASNNTTAHYVPFQEPTVDVSRLPDYRDVGVGRIEPGGSSRRRAALRSQASPFAPQASIHSSHSPSVGSDPTTATHEVTQNGPSLRDIYDLLQRTVSTAEPPANAQGQQAEDEKHSSYDHMVPRLLQSSFTDARPSAPTPRRSRRNPWHSSDESDGDGPHPAGGQPRARAYLHRFASEPAGLGPAAYEPTRESLANAPPTATAAAPVIPSPLAEKLVELAALLAKNSRSKSPTAPAASHPRDADDDKRNELLRRELLLLQRQILARFDEYHAEIDMLRAEVRHASTAPSTAAHRMSLVAPHDSVSVAAADDRQQRVRDADDVFSAASDARSPPLMQMPATAKNKQRHMVQWLSSQQQGGSPGMRRTTVEDIDDVAGEEAGQGYEPSRACVYGGSSDNQDGEEDALSDASTTVPDPADQHRRMSMRAPIGPYLGGAAPATPKRAEQRDMLEMRELLHSVRRSSIHRHRKKQHSAKDPDDDGKMLYSRHLAQQLADTLAELQRVHVRHFHSSSKEDKEPRRRSCAVCAALDAQNHDPYLYGRNAVAYRSMTTRQLQGLLNAYVAAMEDEFGDASSFEEPVVRLASSKPVRHAFTPSRSSGLKPRQTKGAPEEHLPSSSSSTTTRVVIGLLREELDALSRRYHRLVDEFHALDPSNVDHQRRRRTMTRELKDLVDMLDVKGEQIAMLSALHPADAAITSNSKASGVENMDGVAGNKKNKGVGSVRLSAERAYRSARALQQALGELY
ncbi:hypothetical protein GGI23_001851 [Coemansia sp. RSA 2559]|nr:hypothetical protein GGI23_001851 [Coemansia sp. RSA 2559]